jgi:hypothetical protein
MLYNKRIARYKTMLVQDLEYARTSQPLSAKYRQAMP